MQPWWNYHGEFNRSCDRVQLILSMPGDKREGGFKKKLYNGLKGTQVIQVSRGSTRCRLVLITTKHE